MPVNDNNPGRNTSGGIAPRGDEHIRAAIENAEGASDEGDKGGGDGVYRSHFQIFSTAVSKFFPGSFPNFFPVQFLWILV